MRVSLRSSSCIAVCTLRERRFPSPLVPRFSMTVMMGMMILVPSHLPLLPLSTRMRGGGLRKHEQGGFGARGRRRDQVPGWMNAPALTIIFPHRTNHHDPFQPHGARLFGVDVTGGGIQGGVSIFPHPQSLNLKSDFL